MADDSQPSNPDLLADGLVCGALVGPTASGKSRLALAIAERSGAEIVSLDSMQVYRGMDVGTAKPSASEQARVRHHMLDLVAPNERYDVTRYFSDLAPVLADLRSRGVPVLFTGGTAFWLKALLSGLFEGPPADLELRARVESRVRDLGSAGAHSELARVDPRSAARIHANDTKRLVRALEVFEQTGRPLSDWQQQWGWHAPLAREGAPAIPIVGLDVERAELALRIAARARAMLDAGWAEEAAAIRDGPGFGPTSIQALGYREALALHDGEIAREECEARITQRTRQFARRQATWYRKLPVSWIDGGSCDGAGPAPAELASSVLRTLRFPGSPRSSG